MCMEEGGGAGVCVCGGRGRSWSVCVCVCVYVKLQLIIFVFSFPPSLSSLSPPSLLPLLPFSSPCPSLLLSSLSFIQSWDAFFRSATAGAPPGYAYTPPSSLRPSSVLPTTSTTTQVDPSIIRDHLRVQALIRAYQIRGHNIGTGGLPD